MNDTATIGFSIRKFRKIKGLTQEQLAQKSKLSTMSIRRYENGDRIVAEKALTNIAKALEIPVAYLLGWDSIESSLEQVGLSIDDIADELNIEKDALTNIISGNDSSSVSSMIKVIHIATILANEARDRITKNSVNKRFSEAQTWKVRLDEIGRDLEKLNDEGQVEAVKRVKELTEIKKYQHPHEPSPLSAGIKVYGDGPAGSFSPAPQPPAEPQEDTDTTLPPESSEGPQEDE